MQETSAARVGNFGYDRCVEAPGCRAALRNDERNGFVQNLQRALLLPFRRCRVWSAAWFAGWAMLNSFYGVFKGENEFQNGSLLNPGGALSAITNTAQRLLKANTQK